MSRHESVWLATAHRPRFRPLEGDLEADVAVVGGGIVGLTTAYLLAASGASIVLLEAARIAGGTTGGTTGKVSSQHGLVYRDLIDRFGEDIARGYADANQSAISVVEQLAREAGADCQFERAPAYVYTRDPADRSAIEAEHEAALHLGLPATLTAEVDLPFPVEVALRFDDQAHFHAVRYCNALAREMQTRGVRIVERTRALDVDESGDGAVVRTEHGDVRASHVVVTTLLPFVDVGGYFARTRATRAYGIAATLHSGSLHGMHINVGDPTRSTRPWVEGGRRGIVVVGESHPTGEGEATPARWGELERWARENFDVGSFEYRWSAQDYHSFDGLPYVGRAPRTERIHVATGFNKWGLTNGTAAAQIIAAGLRGEVLPWSPAFDATRLGDVQGVATAARENVHVARRFVQDRVGRLLAGKVEDLPRGEGRVVDVDDRAAGAYRDANGHVHAVSVTCTHLGCTLHFNSAERSWDCPCHGSRFDVDGAVVNGPAVHPLEQLQVESADAGPDGDR